MSGLSWSSSYMGHIDEGSLSGLAGQSSLNCAAGTSKCVDESLLFEWGTIIKHRSRNHLPQTHALMKKQTGDWTHMHSL